MAFADWDQISSITRKKVAPKVFDQISKDTAALFRILRLYERQDGGTSYTAPVKYKHSTQGGEYSGLQVLDSAQEQTRTRAQFDWRYYHQPIVLSNPDVAMNGGLEKVVDLVAQETEEAGMDLRDKLATDLFAAQTGDKMDSLVDGCDDGTNVTWFLRS